MSSTLKEDNRVIPDVMPAPRVLSPATLAIHADDRCNKLTDVAPPLHVSTTFRYARDPEQLIAVNDLDLDTFDGHVYSRVANPTSTRLEAILSSLLKGHALSYSSGLAAFHSALVFLNPKRISVGNAYHGCHHVISLVSKLTGLEKLPLDCPAEDLQPGDVVHIETPINPTGEAVSIKKYADKAHSRGAYLIVDATFGPPGLQDPFLWGADVVMHSGTKYLGGHSDMLCGVLAVQKKEWHKGLFWERSVMGNVMGGLEGWLGVRSLRTLEVRVQRQSQNGEKLVAWLNGLLHPEEAAAAAGGVADAASSSGNSELVKKVVARIAHASLQKEDRAGWLEEQMPNGFGPVFAIWMQSEKLARTLPSKLMLFHHATSLGGVESLIEWRAMSDKGADPRLLRVSVGVEAWEDLREDLLEAFKAIAQDA